MVYNVFDSLVGFPLQEEWMWGINRDRMSYIATERNGG